MTSYQTKVKYIIYFISALLKKKLIKTIQKHRSYLILNMLNFMTILFFFHFFEQFRLNISLVSNNLVFYKEQKLKNII